MDIVQHGVVQGHKNAVEGVALSHGVFSSSPGRQRTLQPGTRQQREASGLSVFGAATLEPLLPGRKGSSMTVKEPSGGQPDLS